MLAIDPLKLNNTIKMFNKPEKHFILSKITEYFSMFSMSNSSKAS